jgi:hypothetical protein
MHRLVGGAVEKEEPKGGGIAVGISDGTSKSPSRMGRIYGLRVLRKVRLTAAVGFCVLSEVRRRLGPRGTNSNAHAPWAPARELPIPSAPGRDSLAGFTCLRTSPPAAQEES